MEELLFILGSLLFLVCLVAAWFVLDVLIGVPAHPDSLSAYMAPLAMYVRVRLGIPEPGDFTESGEEEPDVSV